MISLLLNTKAFRSIRCRLFALPELVLSSFAIHNSGQGCRHCLRGGCLPTSLAAGDGSGAILAHRSCISSILDHGCRFLPKHSFCAVWSLGGMGAISQPKPKAQLCQHSTVTPAGLAQPTSSDFLTQPCAWSEGISSTQIGYCSRPDGHQNISSTGRSSLMLQTGHPSCTTALTRTAVAATDLHQLSEGC